MFIVSLIERIAKEKFVIGRNGSPYMTRWTLAGERMGPPGSSAVFAHLFHRGDWDDAFHDHPWPFTSVILAGGYFELTPTSDGSRRRWYHPGSVLRRPASWKHRVELRPGTNALTLVFRGAKEKSWSFFCVDAAGRETGKVVPWKSFLDRVESGALGCGEA